MAKIIIALFLLVLSFAGACASQDALAGFTISMSQSTTPEPTGRLSTEIELEPGNVVNTFDAGNLPWELDELIVASEAIVVGRVKEILDPQRGSGRLPSDTATYIYTDIIIEVEQYLYGGSGNKTIALRLDSGRIGQEVVLINHGPVYNVGETSLLFLYRPGMRPLPAPPAGTLAVDYYQTSGFAQGKWSFTDGTATSPDGRTASLEQVKARIDALRVKMSESFYKSTDFSQYRSYWGMQADMNWEGMSKEQIIQGSDIILIGEVVAIRPSERATGWTTPQRESPMERIYTDVIIRPSKFLKGSAQGDIAIRLPCGRLGNEFAEVGGYLKFNLGESTLLFLRRNSADSLVPYLPIPQGVIQTNYGLDAVGGPQGQWTINGEWVRDRHNEEMRLEDLVKMIGS